MKDRVEEILTQYSLECLENSRFFGDLKANRVSLEQLRDVFVQFYIWRNTFHRWFGLCIAKSPAFGDLGTEAILKELVEHIQVEIEFDHHGMFRAFLAEIGACDPDAVESLQATEEFRESYLANFARPERTFEESLAALAGRELMAPHRNRIITHILETHHDVRTLEYWKEHESLEEEHFHHLWDALAQRFEGEQDQLLTAAKEEILEHLNFWDRVYAHCQGGN